MPLRLPDELLEEVLRRLPPDEPAEFVRAMLVSRRWCRLVSDPGFRRRFRELHRSPPALEMVCSRYDYETKEINTFFVPTTAFCTPPTDLQGMRVVDSRHGRVLLVKKGVNNLVAWDPIKNEVVRELPFPQSRSDAMLWTAAILCSAVACDHLDCHQGPSFLVVFLCSDTYGSTDVYTFQSDTSAWSEPICTPRNYMPQPFMCSVLVGNSLYFANAIGQPALKYDLELCQVSWILLPYLPQTTRLITTEDGRLGLVNIDDCKLYLWSREDTHEVYARWDRRVIELKTVLPDDVNLTRLYVIGSGVGTIIMMIGAEVYTIDLRTYKAKKVYEGTTHNIVLYMSFYTSAFKGTCTGEGPSVGHSSA